MNKWLKQSALLIMLAIAGAFSAPHPAFAESSGTSVVETHYMPSMPYKDTRPAYMSPTPIVRDGYETPVRVKVKNPAKPHGAELKWSPNIPVIRPAKQEQMTYSNMEKNPAGWSAPTAEYVITFYTKEPLKKDSLTFSAK